MLRVNGGEDAMLPGTVGIEYTHNIHSSAHTVQHIQYPHIPTVTSPLFSKDLNRTSLYMCRGDLPAGETKRVSDALTVRAHVAVYVQESQGKEVYNMTEGDLLEVGPFVVRVHVYVCVAAMGL